MNLQSQLMTYQRYWSLKTFVMKAVMNTISMRTQPFKMKNKPENQTNKAPNY